MVKRASLFSAAKPKEAAPPIVEPGAPVQASARKTAVPKSREGKRNVTGFLDPEAFRQLKRIAVDEDGTVQDLLIEGINAVFEKRGLGRIA